MKTCQLQVAKARLSRFISELVREEPNEQVAAFFGEVPEEALHLSALTLGEIRRGVELLAHGAKRNRFSNWLDVELPRRFAGRVLPIDEQVAAVWGQLSAKSRRTLPAIDSLIAATAIAHGLNLLTRNRKDFRGMTVDVSDPWA